MATIKMVVSTIASSWHRCQQFHSHVPDNTSWSLTTSTLASTNAYISIIFGKMVPRINYWKIHGTHNCNYELQNLHRPIKDRHRPSCLIQSIAYEDEQVIQTMIIPTSLAHNPTPIATFNHSFVIVYETYHLHGSASTGMIAIHRHICMLLNRTTGDLFNMKTIRYFHL